MVGLVCCGKVAEWLRRQTVNLLELFRRRFESCSSHLIILKKL
jgi:hypothetical protein